MSEALRAKVDNDETKEVGPNYFGYHIREIQDIFSQNEDFLPFSSHHSISSARTWVKEEVDDTNTNCCRGKEDIDLPCSSSLFSNGIGDGLSDFQRERLKTSLKQSVAVLSQEVDEMLDPVLAISQIKTHLRDKERLSSYPNSSDGNLSQPPCKKQKVSSSPSSMSSPTHAGITGSKSCLEGAGSEEMDGKNRNAVNSEESHFNDLKRSCSDCKKIGPKTLCDTCGIRYKKKKRALVDADGEEEIKREVNEDLLILLENGGSQAKAAVKKHSDELSAKLEHMERQLEELLDVVVSKCRQMSLTEKQQLRKLIQELPPKNLDRVVEIIQHSRRTNGQPCNEIHIDLEKEDNVTLWRLYYYVEAFASAEKLSSYKGKFPV